MIENNAECMRILVLGDYGNFGAHICRRDKMKLRIGHLLSIFVIAFVCAIGTRADTDSNPRVASKVDNSMQSLTVKILPGLTGGLKQAEATYCGAFPSDEITLIVYESSKELYEEPFCSSYGKARTDLIMDAIGKHYILFDFGVGRGTNAPDEYLDIFPVQKDMIEYARIPLAQGAGPVSRWSYTYKILAPASGGLSIVLTRHLTVDGAISVKLPAKTRTVDINTTLHEGPVIFKSGEDPY